MTAAFKKRPGVRSSDLKTTLEALKSCGLEPSALDTMPDGTLRWYFTPPTQNAQSELDRELAEFDARNGHG